MVVDGAERCSSRVRITSRPESQILFLEYPNPEKQKQDDMNRAGICIRTALHWGLFTVEWVILKRGCDNLELMLPFNKL